MGRTMKNKQREYMHYKSVKGWGNRQDDTKYRQIRYRIAGRDLGNHITSAMLKRLSDYFLC